MTKPGTGEGDGDGDASIDDDAPGDAVGGSAGASVGGGPLAVTALVGRASPPPTGAPSNGRSMCVGPHALISNSVNAQAGRVTDLVFTTVPYGMRGQNGSIRAANPVTGRSHPDTFVRTTPAYRACSSAASEG
jgi:hypothetical protein